MSNLMNLPEWVDIPDYEGMYQVSLKGEVKSLTKIRNINGKIEVYLSRLLKQSKISSGYFSVSLWKDGKKKTGLVHRLIAKVFIKNPDGKSQVNHKNGIKTDNSIENLEWVTQSENAHHAIRVGLVPTKRRRNRTA